MKSLVIYDSSFGNTKVVAEEVASELQAQAIQVSACQKTDLAGIELLVVGSPINGWRPLPSITNFFNSFAKDELKGIKATTFDTRIKLFIHGDAKNKIAQQLQNLGAEIIQPTEAFYVEGTNGPLLEGEVAKATLWARSINLKFTN